MKTLIIGFCLLALGIGSPRTMSVEIRGGAWPINLERSTDRPGVSFSLIFRDQEEMNGTLLDTLDFADVQQLRYFGKGLTALQHGNNGDIARFKDYTITRADKKFDGIWYILRPQYGSTSFKQAEADIINKTIQQW
ncbi:MAG TPA: hypothetical protein VHW43_04500 [Puia sp.]|nr:hypothetical protein [Puia sp.]